MSYTNNEAIRSVAETWIKDANKALDREARPAFYAFPPTDWGGSAHPYYSSVNYTRRVVAYLAQYHRGETIRIFERGAWIAVHAATYEQSLDFDPYRPDGTVWDLTLRGYEVVLDAFRRYFGGDLRVDDIPIMSIEGGVFTPNSSSMLGHARLSSDDEHAVQTVKMFLWLEEYSPLQAMCPWLLSSGSKIGNADPRYVEDSWIREEPSTMLSPRAVYYAMRDLRLSREAQSR